MLTYSVKLNVYFNIQSDSLSQLMINVNKQFQQNIQRNQKQVHVTKERGAVRCGAVRCRAERNVHEGSLLCCPTLERICIC